MSQQIAVSEGEMAKRRRQGRSPTMEERGRLRRGRPVRKSPPAEGIHELRRARRGADAPRGGGGVTGAEGAREAPPLPASSQESEGEEDAIARYVFSIPVEEYQPPPPTYE